MSVRSSGHSPGKFCTCLSFFLRTCASNPGCKMAENRAIIFEKQHLLHCMIRSSAQLLKTFKTKSKKTQPCESGRGDGRKNCFPFPINRSRLDATALTGRADSLLFIGSGRRLGQIQGVRWKSGRPWPLNFADCLNPGNGPYLGDLQK